MTTLAGVGETRELRVTCLIVDDLEENLLALSAVLRRDDVDVLPARSGAEALELLLRHDVALAIVDVQMPDMNGFELAELMRGSERTRHVPLIFVTAGGRDQHRLFKGYDRGAVDFLHKPLEPYILQSKADVFFELYRQRQQLAHELRVRTETLRLNETFAAVLGHDLRTPLSAVITAAHLLQRRSGDPAVGELADRIVSSGSRMKRMIDDLLDLTRARLAGGIPINPAPADLGTLVQRVVQEHQAACPGQTIETEPIGDLVGDWDGDRLAQLAANIIGNAVQHGRHSEPVRVRLDGREADCVRLTVENVGTIDAELVASIFDPFRGGRRTGRGDGLGLGLYIAEQIARAHGGRVDVDAADGARTAFIVTIPRERASSSRQENPVREGR